MTCLDGYQMAKQGRAGPALAISAIGSFFAGCVATIIIAVAAPPLTLLAQKFAPADYCSLMLLGLVATMIVSMGLAAAGTPETRWRELLVFTAIMLLIGVSLFIWGLGMPVKVLPWN